MNKKKDCFGLNCKIVLDCNNEILPKLLKIINLSLLNGEFPESWKESVVIPIEKVQNPKNPEDWRPINMLPTYEKILEEIVCNQLTNYIEKENILCLEQSGFRKGHSCETSICWLINEWKKEIDSGKTIIGVFLDLKRAFETIDRNILIEKLNKYGIREVEVKWFKSYLSERFQRVKINETFSEKVKVDLGVPQGSKLGVILFLLYINDIVKTISDAKMSLFADDTLIYVVGDDLKSCESLIQNQIEKINIWLCKNKLKLNVTKTKCMCLNNGGLNVNILINNQPIECVDGIKYLGVFIDNKLKFNQHVYNQCAKISKKIGFFKRIRRYIPLNCAVTIYNTLILPYFDYCSSIIFMSNSENIRKFQVLQNRAMRTVLKCDYRTPINDMLTILGWLNIEQRLKFNALVMIFKIKNEMYPAYLQRNVNYITNSFYNLRNTGDFRLPLYRRAATQNNLLYKGIQLFNSLPSNLKTEQNLNKFKFLLKPLLKDNTV